VKQVNRLKAIVRDLSGEADGSGAGILLTQRTANDDKHPIAVASWGRLVRMDHVDGDRIREIHNTNKGLAPEGFETP